MGDRKRFLRIIKQETFVTQKRITTIICEFPFENLVTEFMCDSSTDTTALRTLETLQHTISSRTTIRRRLSFTTPVDTPQQRVTNPEPVDIPHQPVQHYPPISTDYKYSLHTNF